jgi:glycosyltransferase involved in cell wall biosynthesis
VKNKIDFITASLTGGGAERVLILLANGLIKKNYAVNIITFGGSDNYSFSEKISRIHLHGGTFKNHTIRRFLQLLSHYRKKGNRPDIIISFLPPVSFVTILIARLYKINIIVSEHINHLQIGSSRDQFTRKYLYRLANFTTVLTKFDINYYQKYKANVVVMPNPCTFDILAKNYHKREKSIIAIGSLNRYHHKGFDNLIAIAAPILKKFPTWDLKIIGSGEQGMDLLLNLVKENNIEDRVIFTGFRNDIQTIMKESEIFILPSRFEGLPMVLIEAMSQGMSCIAYDCKTGPSDIIVHNENGLLIEDQNMIAMQTGLEKLIENPELRNRLSINAINSLERFSIENILTKWEKLFAEIL